MNWTQDTLDSLPRRGGVRQRGIDVTRLETFVDAAFAFSMTLLVISVESLPRNFAELQNALLGVPAFAASFALIMMFWLGHRQWSRRYGLEDGLTTALSLALVFVVLVYVYPLKIMFSTFLSWLSGGFLPSNFELSPGNMLSEVIGLFAAYGFGTLAMAGALAALNYRALSRAQQLGLDKLERLRTREQVFSWSTQAGVGLISALFALLAPGGLAAFAGFVYFLLPILMPVIALRFERQANLLEASG